MRGTKPKPTALKLLDGNPGKRPFDPAEPKHDPITVAIPAILINPEAQEEWIRIAPTLIERGQVTTADRGMFICYCQKWAQWLALEREAAQSPFIVKTKSGRMIPNPALVMANAAFLLFLRAAVELGLTPSSRSRVIAQKQSKTPVAAAQSKFAGLLK